MHNRTARNHVGLTMLVFAVATALLAAAFAAAAPGIAAELPAPAGPSFVIRFPENSTTAPFTGRLFAIITKDGESEPKDQVDVTGVPFWGKYVMSAQPGSNVVISAGDPGVDGYPLASPADIAAGQYYVQAFFTFYETYKRADGQELLLPSLSGGGGPQRVFSIPGSLKSKPQSIYIDPSGNAQIELALSEAIPFPSTLAEGEAAQQGNYVDTDLVKYIKIQSKLLSDFWGKPMYIGANILLPRTYAANPDAYYPVLYQQGHWPAGRAPFRYGQGRSIDTFWASDKCPQMIVVEIRDENPFYGTSYSINSANLGPYGDAIVTELIPYIESKFRAIPEGWARLLSGGSTGGWEALALQVWYPDSFGGTWPLCPDSGDFHYFQLINIYEDDNAYYTLYDWLKVERPSARNVDGNLLFTVKQENDWERALGGQNRSGGQWSIWEAVYSPVGPDGYPADIWDPITGCIDKTVAQYWKENYDIRYKLEQEWPTIGTTLQGKIHIRIGDMDNYYLNNGVYKLQEFLESTSDPHYEGYVMTFPRLGHTGNISNEELLVEMAEYLKSRVDDGRVLSLDLK